MALTRQLNIFVYQKPDGNHGAGFVRHVCESRGRIVEIWHVDTASQINYVKQHSSKHKGAYDRVKYLAETAEHYIGSADIIFDDEREAVLLELSALPLKSRISAGIKIIFGRYKEK